MPSQFITPPDHLPTKHNILIINALETELATLVLWLKTVADEYDIHLYHSKMPETDWVVDVANKAHTIMLSNIEESTLSPMLATALIARRDAVVRFGPNADFLDPIQIFLSIKESNV